MKRNVFIAAATFLASGSVASAVDVSEADALFAKRGEGDRLSNVRVARAAYEKLLPKVNATERLHVVHNLNRLDFFEGLLVSNSDAKKELYKGCLNRTESLGRDVVQYFYWRGICLGLLSNEEGLLSALKSTGEVERMLLLGREKDARFDGGGFDRGLAVIYLKVPAINPYGPTRSAEKALQFAERALASPAYPGEQDPDTSTGDYFYNAYDARAQALSALGRKGEAVATLKEAIQRIEQGDLPVGREPETAEILRELKTTLSSIQN